MAVKVFIFGRPGSGKSTAARRIANLAKHIGLLPIRISDYDILHDMFERERNSLSHEPRKFIPSQYGGFDVIDFSVLDTALKEVQRKAQKHIDEYMSNKQKIILIEFARDDYKKALGFFRPDFLRDAYFLFLDVNIDTCIERVHERIAHPISVDDHFVSDKIIRCYYHRDNKEYIVTNLIGDYEIKEQQVVIIDNTKSRQCFDGDIIQFVDGILRQLPQAEKKTEPLQYAPALSPAQAAPV